MSVLNQEIANLLELTKCNSLKEVAELVEELRVNFKESEKVVIAVEKYLYGYVRNKDWKTSATEKLENALKEYQGE